MVDKLSRSQVDQLGERFRGARISAADLQLLDSYRWSFDRSYEYVVRSIENDLGFEPTGRPAKSTTSISAKLARESIRLSQMQDVAGCRIIVPDVLAQDAVVVRITSMFETRSVFDRREASSFGYRAVHVVAVHLDRAIEIQVRTALQHVWAELSEKLSDVVDTSIKYGGGPTELMEVLRVTSQTGGTVENLERNLASLQERHGEREAIAELATSVVETRHALAGMLRDMIEDAHLWKDE